MVDLYCILRDMVAAMPSDLLLANIVLLGLGVTAVFLTNLPALHKARRYGCIFGLLGEIPWLYVAIKTGQVGIIVLCFVYGTGWTTGVYNNFIRGKIHGT